ncbi:MAG: hypothetical protein WC822_05665 [Candidatus Paceibacterota bacterium]|jgi:hypothetical protein
MDLIEATKQFGFPVAIAIYFIWQNGRIEKEHKNDIRTIANQAIQALEKNTDSDKAVTEQLAKNNTALSDTNHLLSKIEGVLSNRRERNNGNQGA